MTASPGLTRIPTANTDTRQTVVSVGDVGGTLAGGAVPPPRDATDHKTRCVQNRHGLTGPLLQRPR